MAAATSSNTALITVLAVIIVAVIAVGAVYLMQDHRSAGQRVGDAVTSLPKGPDKAIDKLGDQPPAKNVERNVSDAAKKAS